MRIIFYYEVYGLTVASQLEFYQLIEGTGQVEADVVIRLCGMPDKIKELKKNGRVREGNPREECWFYTKDTGDFLVLHGREIWVETEENASEVMVQAMVLGMSMALIMLQRDIIAIHGGALEYNGEAFIVSGNCGAGKSTIVHQLMKHTYGFMADDTVAITVKDEIVYANPTYPQQKLCKDAAMGEGYDIASLKQLDEWKDKYAIDRRKEFVSEKMPIKYMFILETGDIKQLTVQEIEGKEKLDKLYANLYLGELYRGCGVEPVFMINSLKLVNQIRMFQIIRPKEENTIEKIVNCIEKIIGVMV